MAKEQPFVQLENISKWYGKRPVLDKINLNIPYGEIFGIIGKSGSGKSTMLNIIVGFLRPNEGKVYFQSRDINYDLTEVQGQFGFAAQDVSFYPRLTVEENLNYFGKMYNLNKKQLNERIPALLKLVNLQGNEGIQGSRLSAGMQKRLDIACALVHEPKVLILDEPTEDLDPALRFELLDLIKKVNDEKNVTVIITSHLLNEVEYLCSRVAILHDRHIISMGKIGDIKDNFSKDNEIIVELQDHNNDEFMKTVRKAPNIKRVAVRQGKVHIYTNKGAEILKNMLSMSVQPKRKFNVTSITLAKPSLEEVFENLTGNKYQDTSQIIKEVAEEHDLEEKEEQKKPQAKQDNIYKIMARDDIKKLITKIATKDIPSKPQQHPKQQDKQIKKQK